MRWAGTWPADKRLHLVHHADVGQALIRALRTNGIDGMTFNAADDAPLTAAELHELNGEPLPRDAATRPLDDPWAGNRGHRRGAHVTRIPADLSHRLHGEGRRGGLT
jgi:nucleoside-diphosphate-sugar epimerase